MIKEIWGKIAYYWFICMLIFVGFFTGDLFVNASDKGYASSSYHAVFTDINDGNFTDVSWSNMGTGISAPSNAKMLRNTYIRIIGSSSYVYKVNNSYTLTYTFSYNPKYRNYIDKLYCGKDVMFSLYGGTSNTSSGIDTANIQSFSVSCEDLPFQDYGVKYTVRFTPTVNLQYILIRNQYNNWFIYYDYRDFSGYPYRMNAINYGGLKIDEQEGTNSVIEKQTQTIINQTNQLNNSINNNTNSINNLDNDLKNDNIDNPNNSINNMTSMLPNNGVITQLIGLPITLYNKVLNSINGTCSSFNLGELYNTSLIIPCIDVSTYLGSTIWTTIDIIISGAFVYVLARKMIKAFNSFTSMKEGDVIND